MSENTYYGDLDISEHGGDCCGVKHLWNFDDEEEFDHKPSLADKIKVIEDKLTRYSGVSETVEVVLTQKQAKMWERALFGCRHKFKRVMEFSNPNTSNILRMYLSTNNQVKPVKPTKRREA